MSDAGNELAKRIETRLVADRDALGFHLQRAREGLTAQRERSMPIVAGGAAVLGGMLLLRALAHRRAAGVRRPAARPAMARATRAMGLVTAAWRLWPQVRALARRVQAERTRSR